MMKVGLTGGIGCGKSAATAVFASLGVPIVDADIAARTVVEAGSAGLAAIEQQFGAGVINDDGSLNRQQLREHIFSNESARKELEAILHPLIRRQMWQQVEQLHSAYCILDIPLLFETKQDELMDRVVVVDCPEKLQIERICQRDNISKAEAVAIIEAQIPRDQRLAGAHDIIENRASLVELKRQVTALHQKYMKHAESFS